MTKNLLVSVAGALCLAAGVFAQTAPQWGQCGGQGWTGATTCPDGWACIETNEYYSQCLQSTSSSSLSSASSAPTGSSSASSASTASGGATSTSAAPGATPTLIAGNSFIRAVEDPNFHQYLRSETINSVGTAVLGDPVDAAQFQINDGQLEQLVPDGTILYATIEPPANSSVVKLGVSWATTPDTLGTFLWGGDTVEWNSATVTRPQNNAWLVCPDAAGNKLLFLNLGPYDYDTPAGCADETIHAYTGATPTA